MAVGAHVGTDIIDFVALGPLHSDDEVVATSRLERNREYYVRVNARKRPQRTFPFALTGPTSGQAKFTFIP